MATAPEPSLPSYPQRAGRKNLTRRTMLGGLAAVALTGAAAELARGVEAPVRRSRGHQPRIAIIGAGLAGLTCAYRLHQQGLATTVYESNPERVGGRCWTARGFAAGQTAEHGGEFIDGVHHRIRALAAELGLTLDDVKAIGRRHPRQTARFYLDGAERTHDEIYQDERLLNVKARADARRIGSWRWDEAGAAARAMDEMTSLEWLEDALPGPEHRLLRLATKQYMAEEYGLDASRLSAINMVWEFGPYGAVSNERYHVHGGNDLIPSGMAERLPAGAIQLDHALQSLCQRGSSSYEMTFEDMRDPVVADVVVLCLPFAALARVDLDAAGLSRRKRRCIEELGMGTNAKVLIQFDEHLGHYDRFNGEYYDEHLDTWNSSLGEPGRPGLLTVYSGGRTGADYQVREAHAPAPPAIVQRTTAAISRVVPGLAEGYAGTAWLDHWVSDPWTRGSYAAFLPGQFTRYWGFVGLPERGLHFAGEHTSTGALGYLEGAVRTGERAAREVEARVLVG